MTAVSQKLISPFHLCARIWKRGLDYKQMHIMCVSVKEQVHLDMIWGLHVCDYEECRHLGYKTPARTSQETHCVSATQSSQLMLCKIWGFHGGDYEECRRLGYKTPARTSQETHCVSATQSSLLMLCKIWGFHGSDYEECRFLGLKTQFVPHWNHNSSPLRSPVL
jgi:hypothetical protein